MDTVTTIGVLVAIVVGSGTGGIIGAIITVKRFHLERQDSEVKQRVDLQSVDVEQFKALFPGGLGDAVEHWRDEAKELYVEVDQLREQRRNDHDEILRLKSELAGTKRELASTQRKLESATARITQLESERIPPHE